PRQTPGFPPRRASLLLEAAQRLGDFRVRRVELQRLLPGLARVLRLAETVIERALHRLDARVFRVLVLQVDQLDQRQLVPVGGVHLGDLRQPGEIALRRRLFRFLAEKLLIGQRRLLHGRAERDPHFVAAALLGHLDFPDTPVLDEPEHVALRRRRNRGRRRRDRWRLRGGRGRGRGGPGGSRGNRSRRRVGERIGRGER